MNKRKGLIVSQRYTEIDLILKAKARERARKRERERLNVCSFVCFSHLALDKNKREVDVIPMNSIFD